MPTPPSVRLGRVTEYAAGFATVEHLGRMPVAGGKAVAVGDTVQVITTTGGALTAIPISAVGASGFYRYTWAGDDSAVDPGPGGLAISGTGAQPRGFAVSSTDADGNPRNLGPLAPGDNITLTDDPATPPITGFARYVITSEPVDQSGWWTFTAERTDQTGAPTPPPVGTTLRVYVGFGGGTGPGGDYVQRAGDTMSGTLNVPRLEIASPDGPTRYQVDTFGSGLGEALYLGLTSGAGLAVNALGVPLVNIPGDNLFRLLDTRDLAGANPYIPAKLGPTDDLNNLTAGAYWWQGADGDPANVPRPYRTGQDGRWLLLQYDQAPMGDPGLGQSWQIATYADEMYVRSASFLFPATEWRQVTGFHDYPVTATGPATHNVTATSPTTIPGAVVTMPDGVKGAWYEIEARAWVAAYGTSGDVRFGIAYSGPGGLSSPANSSPNDYGIQKAHATAGPYNVLTITRAFQNTDGFGQVAGSIGAWRTGSPTTTQVNYSRIRMRRIA